MEHEGTLKQIVLGAPRKVSKGLEKWLEELDIRRIVTIQTTAQLKSAGILRRVLKT